MSSVNIFYIFNNPLHVWNFKRADCMGIIKKDNNINKLIEFAFSECRNQKSDLFVFDKAGNLSSKISFRL